LGNSNAMYDLARMYKYGRKFTIDHEKEIKLLKHSVDMGNSNAMNHLGYMHYIGEHVTQDYNKAIELFKMAIQKNDPIGLANLAFLYHHCDGIEQNYKKAIELYGIAIQKHNSRTSIANLAKLYNDNVVLDYNLLVGHVATYCKYNKKHISKYIDLSDHDIIWTTYLHEYWPYTKHTEANIFLLLLISKHRNTSKIDIKSMIKGITMIIIKYLVAFDNI